MLAIDTNIVVRILTADDPDQAERAKRLVSQNEVQVSVTVLLEAAWALEGRYGMNQTEVVDRLRGFIGLPNVSCEDSGAVATAFVWSNEGVDIADALHLARARDVDEFVTFDRDFAKRAARKAAIPIRLLR